MSTLALDTVPVRFSAGDLASKRESYLMMFRLVVGHALAGGRPLREIAASMDVTHACLSGWIAGQVHDHEVEDMVGRCIAFAHDLGLELAADEEGMPELQVG
jgi:hypothetical protein